MLSILRSAIGAARSFFRPQLELTLENLALRHQLAVLRRTAPKRTNAKTSDRALWSLLVGIWPNWKRAAQLWKPETIVRWHRRGFRWFWTRKSRARRSGRPALDPKTRSLIESMSKANPIWGAPRIHGELQKLGLHVGETTIGKYLPKRDQRPTPSATWRSFLGDHVEELASIDFFTVPTATFRVLYGFVVLAHARRRVVHINVTEHPTAEWTALQIRQAFPFDATPRYLIRDRDGAYGERFRRAAASLGIAEVITAPRSPWQNAFVERWIGSLRRECLDHHIVLGEDHLRRLLLRYVEYYHGDRTHLALAKDAPDERPVESPTMGRVVALPRLGGLHHRYTRRAA